MSSHFGKITPRAHKPPRRAGFVLVLVLVLISVIGFSVAGFARRSLEIALDASIAQEDLQRRWGSWSCREVLLPHADEILMNNSRLNAGSRTWPEPSSLTITVRLGGLEFSALLADEQAKVNLNSLFSRKANQLASTIDAVQNSSARSGLSVLVQPPTSSGSQKQPSGFRSWDQIFDLRVFQNPIDLTSSLRSGTTGLTCWGDGRINLRRAPDEAVRTMCRGQLKTQAIHKLLDSRGNGSFKNLDDLLGKLEFDPGELSSLKRIASETSDCYSLWLTVHSPRREWVSLHVQTSGAGNTSSSEMFTW